MPKPKEFVTLIAERYRWTCPKCNRPHLTFKISKEVKCVKCGEEFKVGARVTQLIPPVELELVDKIFEPGAFTLDKIFDK